MSNDAAQTSDLIQRAYVNLKSVRDSLTSGYVHEEGFFHMFSRALDELGQAGIDVNEWRLPHGAVGNVDANEFRAKIDAILMYFTIQQNKIQIGFHK
jgi:hypothetical protein